MNQAPDSSKSLLLKKSQFNGPVLNYRVLSLPRWSNEVKEWPKVRGEPETRWLLPQQTLCRCPGPLHHPGPGVCSPAHLFPNTAEVSNSKTNTVLLTKQVLNEPSNVIYYQL